MKIKILSTVLWLWAIAVAMLIGYLSYKSPASTPKPKVTASTVLNELRQVSKLVTREADYSTILVIDKPDGWKLDLYDKKIIVKVSCTAMFGFELDSILFTLDTLKKELHISNIPRPKVLYSDVKFKYIDTETGAFTELTSDDYNEVDSLGRQKLKEEIAQTPYLRESNAHLSTIIVNLRTKAQFYGYTLKP